MIFLHKGGDTGSERSPQQASIGRRRGSGTHRGDALERNLRLRVGLAGLWQISSSCLCVAEGVWNEWLPLSLCDKGSSKSIDKEARS